MTTEDLKALPLLQTSTIAEACKDPATLDYILSCLARFFSGDYGETCAEDAEYNNSDLASGSGHVLARYKAAEKLSSDIYIESHFDAEYLDNIEYSHTMIMYPEER